MARKKQTSNPIVLSDGSVDDGKGRIVTTSDGRKVKVDALASSEYWRRREARQQTKNIRDEQKIGEEMKKIYLRMLRESQTQIDAFYQRYADKNGITLAEARKRVSQMDINAYAAKAKKYVKDRDLSDQANEEMALYNLTMKVNRLEMLKAEMGMALVDGFEEMSGIIDRELTERAMSEYERKAGILGKTVQNPAAKAAAIVNASFHNATWSERLWSHQEALKTEIGRQLMSGLIAGKSSRDMAREIRKIFGGSLQNAQRLMVTELARVQTEAARQSMEANGNTEYEYMATGPHPCPECMKLDGEIFKLKEMQVGVNAPPLHPSCHCCTAPYVDGEKYKRWLEALERGEDVRWRDSEVEEENDYNGIPKAWKNVGEISSSNALKGTNPHYSRSIPEYLKGTRDDYTNNCTNCVPAYEMRRRGYIVTACSVGENRRLKHKPFTAWKDRQPDAATGNGLTEILEYMTNNNDDMRVEIAVIFKAQGFDDNHLGHVFVAEKEGGKIQFVDPQSGRIISKNIFKNVKENATMYMRIDDLEISDRGVTACKKVNDNEFQ